MRTVNPGEFDVDFYASAKGFVRIFMTLVGRIEVIGRENVPLTGPLIIACNHVAYLDPPALGCMSPRPVFYMAKKELFDIFFLGKLIRKLGAFPVDRSRGDTPAMKAALRVLQTGAALGIFPEGTRNPERLVVPQVGVAFLAAVSGATVIPAFVDGTTNAKQFKQITVIFGKPIENKLPRKASREALAKYTEDLMGRIYALRENIDGN